MTEQEQQSLAAIKQALAKAMNPPEGALGKAYVQSGVATSGFTYYDLEPGAKDLFPVLTPLRNQIPRVSGKGGEVSPIIRLGTQYGGGKTHGLIAVTHAVRGMKGVTNVADFVDPALLPAGAVRIAALDGENTDPANGRQLEAVAQYTLDGQVYSANLTELNKRRTATPSTGEAIALRVDPATKDAVVADRPICGGGFTV